MQNIFPFNPKITQLISQINQPDWDKIYPQIPKSYNFFKTLDETMRHQFKPYYVCLYQNSKIVCAAPCFIMDYFLDTTLEGPLKKLSEWLKKKIGLKFSLRVLICGCPTAEGRIGIKDSQEPDISQALVNAIFNVAKKENINLVAFKDFSREFDPFFSPLLKMGFHKVQSYPTVELDIHFKSFDEYLAGLSRNTRKSLNKKFRESDKIKIDLQVKNELGDLLDNAYQLYLNTLNKSEVKFEIMSKEFFVNISKNMSDETKYFLWFINGKLVAFDLCLVSGNTLVDEYLGMDYDFAYKYHLYYVSFRDIIIWCINNRIRTYESGALNYDPKKRLDFKFIPQYIYTKHKNFLFNFLIGLLCLIVKPENFDPVIKFLNKERK